MNTKLYHRDIFLPPVVSALANRQYNLAYTRHALTEAVNDKLGALTHAPRSVKFQTYEIVEAELTDGEVTKLVVRLSYDERRDLILVLRHFDDGAATVVTVWTNAIGDKHKTLNRKNYATS